MRDPKPAILIPRPLPDRPNLRHLKDQARDILRRGEAASLADAQSQIARQYGFASWTKLKTHVESLGDIGHLKSAIDANDLDAVIRIMSRNPALHTAPLGYRNSGPLTWVAECRVPWEPPSRERLAMAEWMLNNGSDIHQNGDGPLFRASLVSSRIPMMDLLLRYGADVNARWAGYFPIIFAPCETLEADSLQWLLVHGADPNCRDAREPYEGSALDHVIRTYSRSTNQARCIDILEHAGCETGYNVAPVLHLLRDRIDLLAGDLDRDAALRHRRWSELDFGSTAQRRLTLRGTTLLHVAAEYGNIKAAELLLDRGADVNARAEIESNGVGGQTALFHAVTQFGDYGAKVAQLLISHGADRNIRAVLPGHYERPEEFVECTALGYASRFPEPPYVNSCTALLRDAGAVM